MKDIIEISIKRSTRHLTPSLRLSEKAALYLAGGVLVLDETDGAHILIMAATPEDILAAKVELLEDRSRRAEWREQKIARGSRNN